MGFRPPSGSFTFLTATAVADDFDYEIHTNECWLADVPVDPARYFRKVKGATTYLLEVIDPSNPPGGGGGGGGGGDEDSGGGTAPY